MGPFVPLNTEPDAATALVVAGAGSNGAPGSLVTYSLNGGVAPVSIAPPVDVHATLNAFIGVARDPAGDLYTTVDRFDPQTAPSHGSATVSIVEYAPGATAPQLILSDSEPTGSSASGLFLYATLAVDRAGELLGSNGSGYERITPLEPTDVPPAGSAPPLGQSAIAIDPAGNVELAGVDPASKAAAIVTSSATTDASSVATSSVLRLHGIDTSPGNTLSLAIDAAGDRYVGQSAGPVLLFLAGRATGVADRQSPFQASAIATDPHSGNVFLSDAQSPYELVEMDPHFRLLRIVAMSQASPATQILVY